MRHLMVAMVIAGFACGSAALGGVITVDGDIGDWQALGLALDSPLSPATPTGIVVLTHYGATIVGDTFYAVMEINRPVSDFDRAIAPGAWINADRNLATELMEDGGTLDSLLAGSDIDVEIEGISDGTPAVTYWGLGGEAYEKIDIGTMPAGSVAIAGNVVEWSAPVSTIVAALASLPAPYNVDSSLPWSVYVGGEGKINGISPSWGRHVGGPIDVVPEPGTLTLLAGAAVALAAAALARRRRG